MHRNSPTSSWISRKISRTHLKKPPHLHRNSRETHSKSNPGRHGHFFSDSSFKDKWGTSAQIIEGHKSYLHIISASSTTTGHPEDQEVYRSEMAGLLQIFMIIKTLCGKYNIEEGVITAACDGPNAIRMTMDRHTSFSSRTNHFDMISAINSKIQNSPIQCKWRHVKGHQDEYFFPLDRWDFLNVECNHDANRRWSQDQENSQRPNPSHNF